MGSISFRLKLICIGVVSLVLFCVSALYYNIINNNQKQHLQQETASLASLVAVNLIAPISFSDDIAANEVLAALSTESNIISAYVFNEDHEIFSTYRKPAIPQYTEESLIKENTLHWHNANQKFIYSPNSFHYLAPVKLNDETIGKIYIQTSLEFHKSQKRITLMISISAFMAAIVLIAISFIYIRKWVITPIENLSDLMSQVTQNKNYTLRLEHKSDDQVGKLINGFNQMLEEVKVRDNQLQLWADELELKVSVRTKELRSSNEELEQTISALKQAKVEIDRKEQSKIAAETKEKAKGVFLANMSHELRTPMNGVIGMMSLLKDTGLNNQQDDFLSVAMGSAEYLLSLLNDVLDYSKVESGKIYYEQLAFNPIEIIDETIQIVDENASKKNINLYAFFRNQIPFSLKGDPLRYKQVVINLLSNAIKFTEHGFVAIVVKAIHEEQNTLLELKVIDTGIGIPEDKQAAIFESFQQADSSTTRLYGGTGLGLALSKLIITDMGGAINLSSKPNEGSCFTVTIPFLTDQAPAVPTKNLVIGIMATERYERLSIARRCKQLTRKVYLIPDLTRLTKIAARHPNVCIFIQYETLEKIKGTADFQNQKELKNIRWFPFGNYKHQDDWLNKDQALFSDQKAAKQKCIFFTTPVSHKKIIKAISEIQSTTPSPTEENRELEIQSKIESLIKCNFKLLVVDDNPVNRMVAASLLKKLGIETSQCENGMECIQQLETETYDMILMDCQMPVMDGYEATRTIRNHSNSRIAKSKIVAMTSNAFEEDRQQCLMAGMDDFVTKPVDKNCLAEVLHFWLLDSKSA